jgi:opacity protein-like surface antigen
MRLTMMRNRGGKFMRKLQFIVVFAVITLFSVSAFAVEEQYGKFKVFGGAEYMEFGDIETPDRDMDMDGKIGFTVGLGYNFNPSMGVEFGWSRFSLDEGDIDDPTMDPGDSADIDIDYYSLGATYSIGSRYKLVLGAGAYLCDANVDVSAGHGLESDSDNAFGGYVKAGADIPIVRGLSLEANAGYRYGEDATILDDADVETGGFYLNALLKATF